MVNREQVYDVPLEGRGLAVKARGGPFVPGEFRHMRNCEILEDGSIRNRRSINAIISGGPSNDPALVNMMNINTGFVGHYRSSAISGGKYSHKWYGSTGSTYGEEVRNLWSPAAMNALGHDFTTFGTRDEHSSKITNIANDWRQIVGFFRYNKMIYWIIQSYIQAREGDSKSSTFLHLLSHEEPIGGDLTTITFASLKSTLLFEEDLGTTLSFVRVDPEDTGPEKLPRYTPGVFPQFKKFFIFKDRLWIVSQKTIYASKVTEPAIFRTSEGGAFFNFNEVEINDAVGVKDSVYIVCDNRVYVLTYTNDLNNIADVSIRLISDGQGGDSIVLFRGVVYFARDDALFSVSDLTLTKVRDLDFFEDNDPNFPKTYTWKLVVFGNYIIALARQWAVSTQTTYPGSGIRFPIIDSTQWKNIPTYFQLTMTLPSTTDLSPVITHSTFFINMLNGAAHSYDSVAYGYLQDAYFSPVEDAIDGQQQLFLMHVHGPYSSAPVKSGHWVYGMTLTKDDVAEGTSYDKVINSSFAAVYQGFVTDLEFWVDLEGDEFWVKRFRQILLEGSVCKNMSIVFGFDNVAFTAPTVLNEDISADQITPVRSPYQMRLGINQKSRLLVVRIYKPYADVTHSPLSAENLSYMMLNKIQLLFTQSARGPQRHYASVGRD